MENLRIKSVEKRFRHALLLLCLCASGLSLNAEIIDYQPLTWWG